MLEQDMSEFMNKKPYEPADFLNDNRAIISKVFPDFFEPDQTPDEITTHDPETDYKRLEDKVLTMTAHEPAMQLLGRERFNELPQQQRFQLVTDTLGFVVALKEANDAIEK